MKADAKKTKEQNGDKKDSSYPVYDLSEAIKVAEAVRDLGGSRSPVPKSTLAKKLDLAQSGPSFFQRVGAAKVFGVIAGWGEYQLTPAAKDYFFPTAEGKKQAALITFFKTPALFKRIAERYETSKLPDNETLGNVMHMEGVNESWKDRVAGIFARSAQAAGLIDSNGVLQCTPQPEGGGSPNQDELANKEQPNLLRIFPKQPPTPQGTKQFNFDFDGKIVALTFSENLHAIQWHALNDLVQSIRPKGVLPGKKNG
jgi:hypothetical protein